MKTKKVSISVFQLFIAILIVGIIITLIVVLNKSNKFEISHVKLENFEGSGTIEDPYKIETIEDLVKLSLNVERGESYKDKYFSILNKLDFQNEQSYKDANSKTFGDINKDGKVDTIKNELTNGLGFAPIGGKKKKDTTEVTCFEGTFNGNDNTIKNLLIDISKTDLYDYAGLFAYNKGTITNLKITGKIIANKDIENKTICIAMLVGKNEGEIKVCKTEGEINVIMNKENSSAKVAGIAGENTGKITDSSNNANIISNQLKAGIVANNISNENIKSSGIITNCTNIGQIKEETNTNYYTAGIVAKNQKGNITTCNNEGRIQGQLTAGIVGNSIEGNIIACQNTAEIKNIEDTSSSNSIVAGIAAILDNANMENCKNAGNVIGSTTIGGLAGKNEGTISQCENKGDISKVTVDTTNEAYVGGLTGKNNETAKIINSKNYGKITAVKSDIVNLGGISGTVCSPITIETCENRGNLNGVGKIITPNEDLTINCISCTNSAGGTALNSDIGELYIGIIYGRLENMPEQTQENQQ